MTPERLAELRKRWASTLDDGFDRLVTVELFDAVEALQAEVADAFEIVDEVTRERDDLRAKLALAERHIERLGEYLGEANDSATDLNAKLAACEQFFRIAPDLIGMLSIWCVECGRDSGFHYDICSRAEKGK